MAYALKSARPALYRTGLLRWFHADPAVTGTAWPDLSGSGHGLTLSAAGHMVGPTGVGTGYALDCAAAHGTGSDAGLPVNNEHRAVVCTFRYSAVASGTEWLFGYGSNNDGIGPAIEYGALADNAGLRYAWDVNRAPAATGWHQLTLISLTTSFGTFAYLDGVAYGTGGFDASSLATTLGALGLGIRCDGSGTPWHDKLEMLAIFGGVEWDAAAAAAVYAEWATNNWSNVLNTSGLPDTNPLLAIVTGD